MTVSFDLIATPNEKLGVLEESESVGPDTVREVMTHIATKYDPKVRYLFSMLRVGHFDSFSSSRNDFLQSTIPAENIISQQKKTGEGKSVWPL